MRTRAASRICLFLMAAFTFGGAFRHAVMAIVAGYAVLMGVLLTESRNLAGGTLVAWLAFALYLTDMIVVIEDNHTVFRRKLHPGPDVGGKRCACQSSNHHTYNQHPSHVLSSFILNS